MKVENVLLCVDALRKSKEFLFSNMNIKKTIEREYIEKKKR